MAAMPNDDRRIDDLRDLRERTLAYYRDKFAEHGPTPRGVDWNGHAAQYTLFEQLFKLLPTGRTLSLNDWGCGYGALLDALFDAHLDAHFDKAAARSTSIDYRGFDLDAAMIEAARVRHAGRADASFAVADRPLDEADYGVASGLFALRLERSDARCFEDLADGIATLDATSRLGFAFNCLTAYSDVERMRPHLWYPDPCAVFDLCKRRHARNVALLHDYDLYSFTIIVRKSVEET